MNTNIKFGRIPDEHPSILDRVMRFCLENKLIVVFCILFFVGWGLVVAPFDWDLGGLPRDSVPVDAIPDLGENQQIVFTKWPGRSPQDVEDQVTYPLTVALLGVPKVKTIRSSSMFGFSSITVIFKEDAEFYWARSRIIEKLNSLPRETLPDGVQASLGPDATPLGQIFWYTLEGRDKEGNPASGWDLHELRSVQDWKVRYELASVDGVAEVASIGGYVREYQVEVDPDAMRAHGVDINQIFRAIKMSNTDVGARTIEINSVEYVIRGLGYIKSVKDIEDTVVKATDNVPITVKDVARVSLGPALRRGVLDKNGAETVGGVVVVRTGANPLEVIKRVKEKIEKIQGTLGKRQVGDKESYVTIVPFYDRTKLIYETLGTLNNALIEEILITIIVVIVMVWHLRSSVLISGLLPLAVLMCFIAMKLFGVDANIVALSGIAIAIGTMVDMGIILCENILRHLDTAAPGESRLEVIYRAAKEVGGAVLTAISTTVVSFLPIFAMGGETGRLYKPLAFTKTFALLSSLVVALVIIPPMAHILFSGKDGKRKMRIILHSLIVGAGFILGLLFSWWAGAIIMIIGTYNIIETLSTEKLRETLAYVVHGLILTIVVYFLAGHWMPLGINAGLTNNFIFVLVVMGGLLGFFVLFIRVYPVLLRWCLDNKAIFLIFPAIIILFGAYAWLGPNIIFGEMPEGVKKYEGKKWETVEDGSAADKVRWTLAQDWKGRGNEGRPPLEEGSYLLMPVTMQHASIGEAYDVLSKQDKAIRQIPEIETVVGKIGRADSPLDPAPISMIETIITYKSEWITDKDGDILRFKAVKSKSGVLEFERDSSGNLIPDNDGEPFRQWGQDVKTPQDIWDKIRKAAEIPGTTTASKLQPIAARLVMLQTGIRSRLGMKIHGDSLEKIEAAGIKIEKLLKEVPSVDSNTVFADRIVGKPYLEIKPDREAIKRYQLTIGEVQNIIETAIGGKQVTTTVEGRERYPVLVRYPRELRNTIESLEKILVPTPDGAQIPLIQLTNLADKDAVYRRGPQVIKGENAQLVGYVAFDKKPGFGDVDVISDASEYLAKAVDDGRLVLPDKTNYEFIVAGKTVAEYEQEQNYLWLMFALAIFAIFMILYMQFRSIPTTAAVFSGIFVAWAGGFIMLWCYAQPWFMDFSIAGMNIREMFQMHPVKMSVAVWVGFLALFGIATDDGVVMATYIRQIFADRNPSSVEEIRESVLEAGKRRIRPCLMTTATTILALLPVLTSSGRGSDIMVPMAIPSFGGMLVELVTLFIVPVLYCWGKEIKFKVVNKISKETLPAENS